MILFIITSLVVMVCTRYVDSAAALFIQRHFYASSVWYHYTSDLPDSLLLFAGVTTVCAYAGYRFRAGRNVFDAVTKLCLLIAFAVPAAYGAKIVTKTIFGRINTRVWIQAQETYGFHWFQGGGAFNGFPSGHMVVFTAVLAAFWRIFPRWKNLYLAAGIALSAALIATNYHFVGDVVAGAYLGIIVETAAFRGVIRQRQFRGGA